jgi:hypothetical protein
MSPLDVAEMFGFALVLIYFFSAVAFVPKEIIRLLQFLFLFFGLLVDDGGWKRLIWKDFFLVLSCLEGRDILHGRK